MKLYLVKNGRQCVLEKSVTELPDGIREGCIRRLTESARNKEWKTTGFGAKFMNANSGNIDSDGTIAIRTSVNGLAAHDGRLYFSESIDEASGIYIKNGSLDTTEAIATSASDRTYLGIDIAHRRVVASVGFGAQAHIAVSKASADGLSFDLSFVTDGNSRETEPIWSPADANLLYFASVGLPEGEPSEPTASRGPSSVCRLDLASGELDAILEDDRYDFTSPFPALDGSLYYIRKPYNLRPEPSGCLTALLLAPFRKKSASEPTKKSELRRLTREGKDELVYSGVKCFTLNGDGEVLISDGEKLIWLGEKPETIADSVGVSFMKWLEVE